MSPALPIAANLSPATRQEIGIEALAHTIPITHLANKHQQSFLATDFVPMPDGGMDEIETLMNSSPVGRAFFDGQTVQWVPMPRLQNWSGYDRDSRQALPGANMPVTAPTTPEAFALERVWEKSPDMPSAKCPESKLTKLMSYLERNASEKPLSRRRLFRNWANNHGVNAQNLDEMLITLIECRHLVETSDGLVWQG